MEEYTIQQEKEDVENFYKMHFLEHEISEEEEQFEEDFEENEAEKRLEEWISQVENGTLHENNNIHMRKLYMKELEKCQAYNEIRRKERPDILNKYNIEDIKSKKSLIDLIKDIDRCKKQFAEINGLINEIILENETAEYHKSYYHLSEGLCYLHLRQERLSKKLKEEIEKYENFRLLANR